MYYFIGTFNCEECMEAYPIIVLHKGSSDYLKICLAQAKFSNPNSRIILLGDETNETLAKQVGAEHYLICNYFSKAQEFAKIYKHYSTNPYDYELFCFQRWFVVDEFINSEGLDKFLHIDSDVLLYADFSKELEFIDFINNYDLTYSHVSAHTSFFNSRRALCEFCNFIFEIFSDDSFVAQFEKCPDNDKIYFKQGSFELELTKPLSDMTLVYFFTKLNRLKCLDFTKVDFQKGCINLNFSSNSMQCSSFGNICYTVFDNCNIPYFIDTRDSVPKLLKMHSIHFQGWKKGLMSKYCTFDKKEQIKQINYSNEDLERIFSIKINKQKPQKRSLGRILLNIIEIFVPSRKLRTKIREKLVGYTP